MHAVRALVLSVAVMGIGARASAQAPRKEEPPSSSFADIVERVAPSVVTLLVESDAKRIKGFFGRSYGGVARGGGTGIIVDAKGLILTNYHVVEHALRVDVELHDGRLAKARVLGVDEATDLAVVQAEISGMPAAKLADSSTVRAGDRVLAIGAPFGLRHTVTAGVISSTDRKHPNKMVVASYFQTDTAINPGNSGGPLINMRGEVVGINTAYLGDGTSVGFSIPSNLVREVYGQLAQSKAVERGYAGIHAQPVVQALARHFKLDSTVGALVNKVDKDSPAARGGVFAGDVVLGFDGQKVSDANDLLDRVARARAGQSATLRVWRGGQILSVTLEIASARPPPKLAPSVKPAEDAMLGLKVQVLTPALRQELGYQGVATVVVTGVVPASPADRAGVHSGLAVLQADMRKVEKPRDLVDAIADGAILLLLENNERERAYVLVQAE